MLEAVDIVKSYSVGGQSAPVLRGVNLRIKEGEFVAVTGRSGSGKSTMLNAVAGTFTVDSGGRKAKARLSDLIGKASNTPNTNGVEIY